MHPTGTPDPLGPSKQTKLWRTRLLGWLYRHDWQLAGVLAILVLAAAAFALWPRSTSNPVMPAAISADDAQAAPDRTGIVYIRGGVRNPGPSTPPPAPPA